MKIGVYDLITKNRSSLIDNSWSGIRQFILFQRSFPLFVAYTRKFLLPERRRCFCLLSAAVTIRKRRFNI